MTVEIIEFIDSLDRTNPKGSDPISEGDDHVRNIKAAIQDTFPNITGEVTASHEEINQLVGLEELVTGALPDQPTEESSLLHNVGDKWKETTTIKITGDKAFIPAFAGLGNVNLYVNNDGEIVASEQSTDPTFNHGVNDHNDVDFQGAPEEDDIMIHDGTAWRAKKYEGGNVMTPVEQPGAVGDFSPWQDQGSWVEGTIDGTKSVSFTVPAGMKFYLTEIICIGSAKGGGSYNTVFVPLDTVRMDGVAVWKNAGASVSNSGNARAYLFSNQLAMNDPCFQIKDALTFTYTSDSTGNRIVIYGYFVEDK